MKDIPGVGWIGIFYATWEGVAMETHRIPTITELSHGCWWKRVIAWALPAIVTYHFLANRRR